MPVLNAQNVLPLLRCPRCCGELELESTEPFVGRCADATCALSQRTFRVVQGRPILVDFDNSLFDESQFAQQEGASVIDDRNFGLGRKDTLLKKLGWDTNPNGKRICGEFIERLKARASGGRPRVLVVGGGEVKYAARDLYTDLEIDVLGTDVYVSPFTTLVADGHSLPLADNSVDAVWVQAILEHVLDPHKVVAEIHRVLKADGIVFADTPFIQMVHEGAYDFTRFTLSGHRWLFKEFELLEAGCTNGAAIMLYWSIRYFLRSILGGVGVRLGKLIFFWLPLLDRIGRPRNIADAAGGVYFYGVKSDTAITPADLIDFYEQQKHLPVKKKQGSAF